MISKWIQFGLFIAVLLGSEVAYSDTFQNKNQANVALDGYDAVSYFAASGLVMGQSEYQLRYQGALWYFSSQKNKKIFEQNPSKFTPRFAGHCANGLSDGHLVLANPTIYKVVEDRVYLFFSTWGKAQWLFDQPAQIAQAEHNWAIFNTALE